LKSQKHKKKHKRLPLAHDKKPETRRTVALHALILFVVALAVTASMWSPTILWGHSTRIDLARFVEFDAALGAGDFFPTWSPDLYSGYGSPIFQFYPTLAYYAAEVPVMMGFSFASAFKITWLLGLFASGLAMYRLSATDFSRWAACLGAIFYMVAPYRLVDMFIRHALAEHLAFIWLPLIVWGTEEFVSNLRRRGVVVGALATAALILTHNIMALIGLPLCIAAGWMFALAKRGALSAKALRSEPALWRTLGAAAVVPALGFGLTAFFWWPAMSALALVQAEPSLTSGDFDFHRHFIRAWQFLDLHWNFGISGDDPEIPMPLQIGLPHLLAAFGALTMVVGPWRGEGAAGKRRATWSIVGVCMIAIGVFMCSRLSQSLWGSLPLVKYVQFPWRFLALVVFGSAICATALTDRVAAIGKRWAIMTSLVGAVVIIAAYFPYYSQARFLVGDNRTNSVVMASADEVRALKSAGVMNPIGFLTPAQLRAEKDRGTSSDDFLPRDVKEKPTQPPTQMVQTEGGSVIDSRLIGQNHYRGHVQMPAAGKVELSQFWFPGWQATVDGLPARTGPAGSNAIVSCDVPAGEHVIEFAYRSLPQRRIGIIISILSATMGACILWFLRRGSRPGG
jgi:hypothetical protein